MQLMLGHPSYDIRKRKKRKSVNIYPDTDRHMHVRCYITYVFFDFLWFKGLS